MSKIIITNNTCRLICSTELIDDLRLQTRIKAQGAFFSPAFRNGQWDGYVYYITKTGTFKTGLLPEFCGILKEMERGYDLVDKRVNFRAQYDIDTLGGMEFFEHQKESLDAVMDNTFEGIKFPRGLLNEATNAGKSLIAGGVFASLSSKRTGLYLINNKELYLQALEDLEKLLPGEIGRCDSKKTEWKRINVCMVQTLGNRIKKDIKYRNFLARVDAVVVDEVDDVMNRKDCKAILAEAFNSSIRVGMSGTSQLHKDKNRNKAIVSYFGPILHRTTNKELVDKGISCKPDIRIYLGNEHIRIEGDYALEYEKGITKNRRRHAKIWKLAERYIRKKKTLPMLILFKYHGHGERLLRDCPPAMLDKFRIKLVHHKIKNRTAIFKEFNDGKVDILLSSMIIRRGKNLPMIKLLMNAAGGDSHAQTLQIFGRALRTHKSKKKVYMLDFWDTGKYLRKHSNHRRIYYSNEKFPVLERYKKELQK